MKYHDNRNGIQYGEDGTLTNNWNPDLDYGNEYVNVYFRIDTPSYHFSNGFPDVEASVNWHTEISSILSRLGIFEDSGWTVEHSDNKQAYLYAHPQNISGVVLKNDVKRIAEAVSKMKLSSLEHVDLFDTVFDISDEDYIKYLSERKDEIRTAIFKASATSRRSSYCSANEVARYVATPFKISRLGYNDGRNYGMGETAEYVLTVIDEMVSDGYIKCYEDNGFKYIRSLNKTEQKATGLKL